MNLANVIQQQLLQSLIASLATQPDLTTGSIIAGRVTKLGADGDATLQTLQGQISLKIAQAGAEGEKPLPALQLGQVLKLEISGKNETGALTAKLLGTEPRPPVSGAATATPRVAAELSQVIGQPAAPDRITAARITAASLRTQDSLAPLFANLSAIANSGVQAYLPTAVINASARVLGFRLPADTPPTAADLRRSVSQSGLFREARLRADGYTAATSPDLKSALLALRDALASALTGSGINVTNVASLANAATDEIIEQGDLVAVGKAPEPGLRTPKTVDGSSTADLAPPRRNGQPVPQSAALATLDVKTATPETVLRVLTSQTDAALDRQSLLQVASLAPNATDIRQEGGAVQRWFAEIPMQMETRTPILPLEIERDRRGQSGQAGDQPAWRVRFALDGEPLGILHALVMMQGRRLGVTFWAERETTRAALRQAGPDLSAALEGPYFNEASIDVQAGQPFVAAPEISGQFVDTRT